MAFATPRIASARVGGVRNLVTEGASAVMGVANGAVGVGCLGEAFLDWVWSEPVTRA